ncbi:FBOX [Musa troglodytarum]|uniref:FBOX n=1 Tax=Musa troglodytarum TaxID=320322 RepID=A0A9E7EDX3_9LILI|nr:FBOX [Musa troglodytarum]
MAETPILSSNPPWAPRSDDVAVFIPEDLTSMILMCLPVKSIVRFKSVSRDWHRTISSKSFITSHLHRSKTNPTNLIIPSTYNEVSERIFERDLLGSALRQINAVMYHEVPSRIRMYRYGEAGRVDRATLFFETVTDRIKRCIDDPLHSDGLLLFSVSPCRTYLCNPATRKLIDLPTAGLVCDPKLEYNLGFGLDPRTNNYKVVRYFCQSGRHFDCDVFTVGTTPAAWRAATVPPPYPIAKNPSACVEGSIYWFIDPTKHEWSPPEDKILAFSLSDEEFRLVSAPPTSRWHPRTARLVEFEGSLCFVNNLMDEQVLEMWMSSDSDETLAWIRSYTINLSDELLQWIRRYIYNLSPPEETRYIMPIRVHGEKIILRLPRAIAWYNLRSQNFDRFVKMQQDILFLGYQTYVMHYNMPFTEYRFTPYVESLVPLGG